MFDGIDRSQGDCSENIYSWIETIPFSKGKRNSIKDFSDAVYIAEILKVYYPRAVDLHNYASANGVNVKKENWNTLNRKVLSKIGMKLNKDTVHQLANGHQGAIKKILQELKNKVTENTDNEQPLAFNNNKENESSELNQEEMNELENYNENEKLITESFPVPVEIPTQILSKLEYSMEIVLWGIWQLIKWLFFWNVVSLFLRSLKNTFSKTKIEPIEMEPKDSEDSIEITVPRSVCMKLKHQLEEKNDVISSLTHKLTYLESVIKLRDSKISQLTSKLLQKAVNIEENSKVQKIPIVERNLSFA